MSIFSFFKKKQALPEISEELFTLKDNLSDLPTYQEYQATLAGVYKYLRSDFENKGFSDCLVNSERTYMNENINIILKDLLILIDESIQNLKDELKQIDFHISTREDEGLTNLVKELKVKRETVETHMTKLEEFQVDAQERKGSCEKVMKSYQRGFQRGYVSISSSKILGQTKVSDEKYMD